MSILEEIVPPTSSPAPATLPGNTISFHPPIAPARLTIRPRSGWISINLPELWRFRELLFSLTARDIKLRYKQTALGVAWVVLQPLVAAGIFSFVFGKLANLPADKTMSGQNIPYFLFSFSGLVAWTLFFSAMGRISQILVSNSTLVSKVYFPRMLLPLAGGMGVTVDLLVMMLMLLVMQLFAGVGLTPRWFLAPVILTLVMSLSLGLGMWAGALCVAYRDVGYILPVVLQFLLYASPVGYSGAVGAKYGVLFYANPLAGLLDAWRWSTLSTPFPPTWAFLYSAAFAALSLLIGAMVFRRMERTFADVI